MFSETYILFVDPESNEEEEKCLTKFRPQMLSKLQSSQIWLDLGGFTISAIYETFRLGGAGILR